MLFGLIKEVVDQLEIFIQEGHGSDLRDFTVWLYNQVREGEREETKTPPIVDANLDVQIAQLINVLYAHSKQYTKTALKGTPLISMTDFGFLSVLVEEESVRKTELISRNYSELSPGIEVIKRLIRENLIEDFKDPVDGRSRRVRITPFGKEIYDQVLEQMNRAARITSGNLAVEEKLQMLALSNKLKSFHQPIWDMGRSLEFEELEERFFQNGETGKST
ncbi:MAG: winged helix DNA-binding protein [Lewinellaceae bacterium]|nr:winged helix DNA-binding protein [Lewinellaceae bacterium]